MLLKKIHCDMKLAIFDFLRYMTFVGVWKCFYVENGFSINFAKSCYGHLGTSFSLFAQSSFILHSTCVVNKFLLNFRFVWTRQWNARIRHLFYICICPQMTEYMATCYTATLSVDMIQKSNFTQEFVGLEYLMTKKLRSKGLKNNLNATF